MAQEEGTRITGKAVPSDENDSYATHEDRLGQGGFRVCADLAEMYAIPYDRRVDKLGMEVKISDGSGGFVTYELINEPGNGNNTTASDWQEKVGGGNKTPFIYRNDVTEDVAPTNTEFSSPSDGDTTIIKLDNTLLEFWTFTTAWAKDYKVDLGTNVANEIGSHNPETIEYPDLTGVESGYWIIAGLTSEPYTFISGQLDTQTINNGDQMVFDGLYWFIVPQGDAIPDLEEYTTYDPNRVFISNDGDDTLGKPFNAKKPFKTLNAAIAHMQANFNIIDWRQLDFVFLRSFSSSEYLGLNSYTLDEPDYDISYLNLEIPKGVKVLGQCYNGTGNAFGTVSTILYLKGGGRIDVGSGTGTLCYVFNADGMDEIKNSSNNLITGSLSSSNIIKNVRLIECLGYIKVYDKPVFMNIDTIKSTSNHVFYSANHEYEIAGVKNIISNTKHIDYEPYNNRIRIFSDANLVSETNNTFGGTLGCCYGRKVKLTRCKLITNWNDSEAVNIVAMSAIDYNYYNIKDCELIVPDTADYNINSPVNKLAWTSMTNVTMNKGIKDWIKNTITYSFGVGTALTNAGDADVGSWIRMTTTIQDPIFRNWTPRVVEYQVQAGDTSEMIMNGLLSDLHTKASDGYSDANGGNLLDGLSGTYEGLYGGTYNIKITSPIISQWTLFESFENCEYDNSNSNALKGVINNTDRENLDKTVHISKVYEIYNE